MPTETLDQDLNLKAQVLMFPKFALLLFLAGQVLPSRAELSVSANDVQLAVDNLASKFTSIRNEGLGIDVLEV